MLVEKETIKGVQDKRHSTMLDPTSWQHPLVGSRKSRGVNRKLLGITLGNGGYGG